MSPHRVAALVPMLSSLALSALLAGCSAGGTTTTSEYAQASDTDGGDTDTDGGSDTGWVGHEAVETTLNNNCAGCHSGQWSSCWNVQDNASSIQSVVSSGAMPRGATMAMADQSTLLTWIKLGAPCNGTRPAGLTSGAIGGGGTPATPGAAPSQ